MNLIVFAILLPILTAMLAICVRQNLTAQRVVAGLGTIGGVILTGYLLWLVRDGSILTLRVGEWPAAFGVVLIVDLMAALMMFFASITQLAVFLFIAGGAVSKHQEQTLMHPALLLLASSVNWSFMTGDIFNLFVAFEIMLLSSYVLLIHGNRTFQLREAAKFAILNLFASLMFLAACAYAYGMFGSLNFAELAVRIERAGYPPEAFILGVLCFLVFGAKAAIFPLFFWLPDSYPRIAPGIVAYFAGILTKVGVYCLYRFFTVVYTAEVFFAWFQPWVLIIAGLTMFIGVMGAYSQYTFKRILSFHIISQIGYMIFGLAIFTPLAIAFGIFYVVHNMVVKASLLLVADTVVAREGTDELKKVSGLITRAPILAITFAFAAFSLAGIPPLSGFYGKFGFIFEGIREGHILIVVVSVVTGLFTLASMTKIWRYSFWGESSQVDDNRVPTNYGALLGATMLLVGISLGLAVASGPFMSLMALSGEQLMGRADYIVAVLGEQALMEIDIADGRIVP